MPLSAPASANRDHQELQRLLVRVQQLSGKTGALAEGLAGPLQAHMEKEETLALPLLGILAELVQGKLTKGQALRASRLYSKMKEEYPGLLRRHKEITRQLSRLKKVGADEGHLTAVRFAEALEQHAQQEEEVLYPAHSSLGNWLLHPSRGNRPERSASPSPTCPDAHITLRNDPKLWV